ncbi:MAG TPA: type II toxin-antitoxin system prevent-host-death family antitoxin [Gaiellaceae bacterium]|nr:type II toxin-antitoxin system prevent-host-death family antitoxin [Gaiellaceae bacterium]
MTIIPQKELRNNVSDVLRRAEAGEEFTITVAGRPVAGLGPVARRHWVGYDRIREIFAGPADPAWRTDVELLDGVVGDPWRG